MFGHRLTRHIKVFAQLRQRPPVALVQPVEQLSAAPISQRLKYCIHHASHYATIWLHVKRQVFSRTAAMSAGLAAAGNLVIPLGASNAFNFDHWLRWAPPQPKMRAALLRGLTEVQIDIHARIEPVMKGEKGKWH